MAFASWLAAVFEDDPSGLDSPARTPRSDTASSRDVSGEGGAIELDSIVEREGGEG